VYFIQKKKIIRHERKRNPLKHPRLYARLNPLFDQQYEGIIKKYKRGSKVRTTKLLKPLKKSTRIHSTLSDDDKQKLRQQYWKVVFGDSKTFKTRPQLLAEKEAVRKAMAAIEKEKKGFQDEDLKDNEDEQ